MARGIRKAATPKLPDGVKWASHVPVLVIPSAGHSAKGDGADGSLRRQSGPAKRETEVKLRYPACCETHKGQIKVDSLVTEQELLALCSRLTQHHGHGRLIPERARIEWVKCEDSIHCADCLTEAAEKAGVTEQELLAGVRKVA